MFVSQMVGNIDAVDVENMNAVDVSGEREFGQTARDLHEKKMNDPASTRKSPWSTADWCSQVGY